MKTRKSGREHTQRAQFRDGTQKVIRNLGQLPPSGKDAKRKPRLQYSV